MPGDEFAGQLLASRSFNNKFTQQIGGALAGVEYTEELSRGPRTEDAEATEQVLHGAEDRVDEAG